MSKPAYLRLSGLGGEGVPLSELTALLTRDGCRTRSGTCVMLGSDRTGLRRGDVRASGRDRLRTFSPSGETEWIRFGMARKMAERIRKLSRTLERRNSRSAAKDASCCLCAGGAPLSDFSQPPCASPELHRRPSCLIRNPSTFSRPATLRQSSSSSCRLAALRSRAARTWARAVPRIS